MTVPADGWEDEERDLPEDLARELSNLRGSATALPIEVLRAAGTGVLPGDLDRAASEHLSRDPRARALVEDLNDSAELDPHSAARLYARITREAEASRPRPSTSRWMWAAAAAMVITVAGTSFMLRQRPQLPAVAVTPPPAATPEATGPATPAPVTTPPLATFLLPLERPDVRVSLKALTWRGQGPDNPVLVAMKPALEAFRAGDYSKADQAFSVVESRYPDLVEVALYQGVTRLFLHDWNGALDRLKRAQALDDPAFADDVEWFLAVAWERSGNVAEARRQLQAGCTRNPAGRACQVLSRTSMIVLTWRRVLPLLAAIAVAISNGTLAASPPAAQLPLATSDPHALLSQGESLVKQGQRADADRVLKAAIEAANQTTMESGDRDRVIGSAAMLLAGMRPQAAQSSEAVDYFQQALTAFERLNDDAGVARALVGIVSRGRQPFAEEEKLLERAVPRARDAGLKSTEAAALHLWADGLFIDGQYERALSKLLEAEGVAKVANDIEELGTIYNSLGRLYRNHGQLETALNYQLKALSLHEKLPGSVVLMQSLNAVGVTYQAMGDYANGRLYMNRALQTAVATASTRIQDFIRANLVDSMIEQGSYAETALMLEGVIERKLDAYPYQRYAQLADVYRLMGRLDDALTAGDMAIQLCGAREDSFCVNALNDRAEVHLARGNRAGALADLNAALAMLERIRARLVPTDFFRQNFGRSQQAAYSRTIEMQVADGLVREALETAELARSRAFVDLLAGRDMAMHDGAKSAPPATVADLTRVATRLGSTLVMYWVTPTRLYMWTVSPGGDVHVATVAVRESKLAELVRSTAPLSGSGSAPLVATVRARGDAELSIAKADAGTWRGLYDVLLRPVRHWLPRTPGALITIVPHGPLSMLSFAALQDEQDRYLIEDFTLNYVPAGAVLDFTAARRRADARSSDMLLVADPSYHRKSTLDPLLPALPGSRVEARSIAKLLAKDRVTLLEGNAATEQRVRDLTIGKGVLHFATHAIVSDADPFNSFLALAGSAASADDGTLTAQEIYGLKLQADVVVLSACRSGGGRVTGDGMATFARAFMYAGAPSLITSVWDVADESSAQLIPGFYRAWRAGASKAKALRSTQLAFLRNLRAGAVKVQSVAGPLILPAHPALWAGFMLIGEPD